MITIRIVIIIITTTILLLPIMLTNNADDEGLNIQIGAWGPGSFRKNNLVKKQRVGVVLGTLRGYYY